MKTISIVIGILLTSILNAQSTALSELVDKYAGQEGYTYVYVTEYMFQLAAAFAEDEEPEAKELLNSLDKLVVLSVDGETNKARPQRFSDEVQKAMPTDDYKILLKVKDGGEDVDIIAYEQADTIRELIITVKSDSEDLLLILTGNIDLKSIARLSKTMDIDGLEHLDNVDETTIN